MFAPLRTLMITLWMLCAAGGAIVVALSVGAAQPMDFFLAGLVGLVVGIPAGLWTAREIKRDDPNWPPHRHA